MARTCTASSEAAKGERGQERTTSQHRLLLLLLLPPPRRVNSSSLLQRQILRPILGSFSAAACPRLLSTPSSFPSSFFSSCRLILPRPYPSIHPLSPLLGHPSLQPNTHTTMAAIQNFKNFLRHGKQARHNAEPTTDVSPVHAQPQQRHRAPDPVHHGITEPVMDTKHMHRQPNPPANFSVAAGDNRNIAAQAGDVAARAAADKQKNIAAAKQAGVDPTVLERIVAEERDARNRMPKYPGLERWILLEKMGDGAFSNVYRARDTTGQWGEVAIKVVRKFEMNSQQVSISPRLCISLSTPFMSPHSIPTTLQHSPFFWPLPTQGRSRATSMCIRTSKRQKQPRCDTIPDADVQSLGIIHYICKISGQTLTLYPVESQYLEGSPDYATT